LNRFVLKKLMFCQKSLELVRELHRNKNASLTPYNEEKIRQVIEENKTLYVINQKVVRSVAGQESNFADVAAVQMRHEALHRNKRCLLAYLNHRIEKIRSYRWEFGSVLPRQVKVNLSESENQWFLRYNRSLAKYMSCLGEGGLDLTVCQKPPDSLFIEVRCLRNRGEFQLSDGSTILLKKNSIHFLPRSQCETLIREGILEHVS